MGRRQCLLAEEKKLFSRSTPKFRRRIIRWLSKMIQPLGRELGAEGTPEMAAVWC